MSTPVNLHDIERLAQAHLHPAAYHYFAGGALDEVTVRANEAAFLERRLRPRVLVDVSSLDTAVTLLGRPVGLPIGIAPTAQHGIACERGELAAARAGAAAGIVFCASTFSTLSMEEIATAGGCQWFQLYVQKDRAVTEMLVQRAIAAGYKALVLTVDTPVSSRRERDLRVTEPAQYSYGNFAGMNVGSADASTMISKLLDPAITWRDAAWLKEYSGLPLALKGIVTADDARLAVEHGVDAIWVSNHGGRQLDRSVATMDVLAEIVDAVAGRAEVYVDGGVRRGIDAAVALAVGASAVFLGRPIVYAAGWDGEAGVRTALQLIGDELRNAMALLGAPDVASLTRAHVA
jgi:4-hydroxymandelate oxidase